MTQIIVTTPEELEHLIHAQVKHALEEALPQVIRRATRKQYYTTNELMELTGWSRPTLQRLRDTKQIPFIQHGQKILYPTDGLEEFFESHRIDPW